MKSILKSISDLIQSLVFNEESKNQKSFELQKWENYNIPVVINSSRSDNNAQKIERFVDLIKKEFSQTKNDPNVVHFPYPISQEELQITQLELAQMHCRKQKFHYN